MDKLTKLRTHDWSHRKGAGIFAVTDRSDFEYLTSYVWTQYEDCTREHQFVHLESVPHLTQCKSIRRQFEVIEEKKTKAKSKSRKRRGFPGARPISMFKGDIPDFYSGACAYRVLPKSNGERFLLALTKKDDRCYCVLLDLARRLWAVQADGELPTAFFDGTVLDMEWVGDEAHVFDVLQLVGKLVGHKDYCKRMEACFRLFRAWQNAKKQTDEKEEGKWIKIHTPTLPFDVVLKRPYTLEEMTTFASTVLPKLKFPIDGGSSLVLMPVEPPVTSGHSAMIKKYKPRVEHTADFEIRMRIKADDRPFQPLQDVTKAVFKETRGMVRLYLFTCRDELNDFDRLDLDDATKAKVASAQKETEGANDTGIFFATSALYPGSPMCDEELDGCIVEARWNDLLQYWEPVLLRREKKTPNTLYVVLATVQNNRENMQWSDLFPFAQDTPPAAPSHYK